MAAFVKFNSFVEALGRKAHNLNADVLKIALTNSAPSAGNTVLTDITEISYTNLSARTLAGVAYSQTGGVGKLTATDLTLTASGVVAGFRYAVLYNDTASNDELIGYWDYGVTVALQNNGETFLLDFDGTNGILTIT